MRSVRTLLVILLCVASVVCQAEESGPLKMSPSRVVKMELQQWEDYCNDRNVFYKDAATYYVECWEKVNAARVRHKPRAVRTAWRHTAALLRDWLNAYSDWQEAAVSVGTGQYNMEVGAQAECEQTLARVMHGYAKPQGNRRASYSQLYSAFWLVRYDLSHHPLKIRENIVRYEASVADLKVASSKLWHHAAQQSPNTQKAIADFVRLAHSST